MGGLIVFGWLDYLVRFEDRGLRIMASLAFLAAVGWTAYRHFYLPRQKPLGDADLAMKIERRFPNLEDRLASSVDFLGQEENDPTAGSPVLRRAVIAQTDRRDGESRFQCRSRFSARDAGIVCGSDGVSIGGNIHRA